MAARVENLYRWLDTNGDGTGAKNAVGDYSVTPGEFFIQAPTDKHYHIKRVIVSIEDTSGFSAQEYGNTGAALAAGITVKVDDGAGDEILDLTDGFIITQNSEWGALCHDADLKTWGVGAELLTARWTFSKAGYDVLLQRGQRLVIGLNDDLTGLIGHRFFAQGFSSRQY